MPRARANARAEPVSLTTEQEQAVDLLIAGEEPRAVAAAVGVQLADLLTWQTKEPLFVAALNARRAGLWSANGERLRGLAAEAIETLADLLKSDSEVIKLKAAATVLRAARLAELDQPTDRLTVAEVKEDMRRREPLFGW